MSEGWIKLYRKMSDWEWSTKPETSHLFIHLLLSANHKDGLWRGVKIPAGSFVTGRKSLSIKTGLSEQKIRTALKHLKSTNELTIQSTNEYSIISITNWEKYQDNAQRPTSNQPAINQQSTTNKNNNNEKNEKNILGADKSASKKPVYESRLEDWMAKEGYMDIPREWGDYAYQTLFMTVEDINLQWDKFLDYWKSKGGAKGKKADWPATWRNWCRTSIEYKSERTK